MKTSLKKLYLIFSVFCALQSSQPLQASSAQNQTLQQPSFLTKITASAVSYFISLARSATPDQVDVALTSTSSLQTEEDSPSRSLDEKIQNGITVVCENFHPMLTLKTLAISYPELNYIIGLSQTYNALKTIDSLTERTYSSSQKSTANSSTSVAKRIGKTLYYFTKNNPFITLELSVRQTFLNPGIRHFLAGTNPYLSLTLTGADISLLTTSMGRSLKTAYHGVKNMRLTKTAKVALGGAMALMILQPAAAQIITTNRNWWEHPVATGKYQQDDLSKHFCRTPEWKDYREGIDCVYEKGGLMKCITDHIMSGVIQVNAMRTSSPNNLYQSNFKLCPNSVIRWDMVIKNTLFLSEICIAPALSCEEFPPIRTALCYSNPIKLDLRREDIHPVYQGTYNHEYEPYYEVAHAHRHSRAVKGFSIPHEHCMAKVTVTRDDLDPKACYEIYGGLNALSILSSGKTSFTQKDFKTIVMKPNLNITFVPEDPFLSLSTQYLPEERVEEILKQHDPRGQGFAVHKNYVSAVSTSDKDEL